MGKEIAIHRAKHTGQRSTSHPPLRVGFVPLTDCAPLVMAAELGLFRKRGLRVELKRELGWATIRDKVIYRELDAAHTVAGMPFAATLGLGSMAVECVTALVLNHHGNAITISDKLWKAGVRDAESLRKEIFRRGASDRLTFGIVYQFSSHNFLLRSWLATAGINPERDVRIVVVPPAQMVSNLKAGHLDCFCVGEPWNSVAARSGAGWCLAASAELAPGHPEKVLMTRRDFAEKKHAEHLGLVAAIFEACRFCQEPRNHPQVISTLARPEYVGVPDALLARGFKGEVEFGPRHLRAVPNFNVFYSIETNDPTADKAAWVLRHLRLCVPGRDPGVFKPSLARQVFRSDLFEQATRRDPLLNNSLQIDEKKSDTDLVIEA
jgi:ABC-type nitrate/sulfonate/bicarbonate transport system substrate-binding protein